VVNIFLIYVNTITDSNQRSYCLLLFPKAIRGLELTSYREVLLSTLLHATVYMFLHNLLNVLVHIANKIGLKKCYWC
jgi:hypothetical protein